MKMVQNSHAKQISLKFAIMYLDSCPIELLRTTNKRRKTKPRDQSD